MIERKKKTLNTQLAQALDDSGSSIQDLAHAAKVHPFTLSRALHGMVIPHPMTAWRIAKALNTTAEALGLTEGTSSTAKTEVIE